MASWWCPLATTFQRFHSLLREHGVFKTCRQSLRAQCKCWMISTSHLHLTFSYVHREFMALCVFTIPYVLHYTFWSPHMSSIVHACYSVFSPLCHYHMRLSKHHVFTALKVYCFHYHLLYSICSFYDYLFPWSSRVMNSTASLVLGAWAPWASNLVFSVFFA